MKTLRFFCSVCILVFTTTLFADTLPIITNGESAYTIIYAESGQEYAEAMAQELATAVYNITGCKLPIAHDGTAETDCEIIIGPHNTRSVCDSLENTIGKYGYCIALIEKKIIITATDDDHLVLALKHFEESVLKDKTLADANLLQITATQAYTAIFPQTQITLRNVVRNQWAHTLSLTKLCTVPADGTLKVSQGVCTDGTNVYFVLRNSSDTQARVYKYRMSDWSFVSKTDIFNGGHCNDLMYDTPNKRIICIKGGTNGDIKELTMAIDPETMAVTEGPNIPEGATAIDYNPALNLYITRYGKTINVRNNDFSIKQAGSRTDGVDMTAQGMGTDEEFFYFPMSPKSGERYNALLVYDWANLHCKAILEVPTTAESESMFEHNGTYYISFYQNSNGATLYRVNISLHYTAPNWTIQHSTLTIDTDGGQNVLPQDIYTQDVHTALTIPNPIRENHTFVSWDNTTSQNICNYQGFECSSPDSVIFNGTNKYVTVGRQYMYQEAITFNLWAYMDNWADYTKGMRLVSCTEAGGFNIEIGASKFVQFACYDFGVGYKNARATTKWEELTSGWHMFTMVFDGHNARGYIDGVLAATSKDYVSGKIGYHRKNSILLGAEVKDSNKPAGTPNYFKGMLKNVAFLPTALTAEEIALLYANPGIARYYFSTTDVTMKAIWEELPIEDAVSDIKETACTLHISTSAIEIVGVKAARIFLYTVDGKQVNSTYNNNTLYLNKLQGIYIVKVIDTKGNIHTQQVTL